MKYQTEEDVVTVSHASSLRSLRELGERLIAAVENDPGEWQREALHDQLTILINSLARELHVPTRETYTPLPPNP